MPSILRRVWRRGRSLLPVEGFAFGRPLVVLQSDDWGRVGVRDREGWEDLRDAGVNLGERSYDFYSLETAEDIAAIIALLHHHRDSTGRPACLGMNFIVANVDFKKVEADNFRQIHVRTLTEGLPDGWMRRVCSRPTGREYPRAYCRPRYMGPHIFAGPRPNGT